MDGHRVAPSNQDGSVNIDVLPQMLVERVDIRSTSSAPPGARPCSAIADISRWPRVSAART
jgi:hypothetical protein